MDTNIAYLAGIIDGEGSIGIELLSKRKNRPKEYYTCRLTVINTSERLMKRLCDTFGGSYDMRKQIEGRKKCFRWHIFGENMEKALYDLLPYLDLKKEQASLLIEFRKTKITGLRKVSDDVLKIRRSLWLHCKELNK